jgi:LuxR family maltose regulon positive regulatory protein
VLASREGYVRVFVDEGAPIARLLGALLAPGTIARVREVPPGYLRRLIGAFKQGEPATPGHGRRGAAPGLVEPLSDRELEVLGLLAAGKLNRQIADNRTQAVTHARELGLIPYWQPGGLVGARNSVHPR